MNDPTAPQSVTAVDKPVPRMVGHLHAFRGITIVMIVAVHVSAITFYFNYDSANAGLAIGIVSALNEALFHNATIFFAMISGILFARVLKSRGWPRFFRSKLLNVAAPYAVMTFFYALFALDVLNGGYIDTYTGSVAAFPREWVADYLHLQVQSNPIFWYLPVLLMLFALTPLIVAVLRTRGAPVVLAAILIVPLVVSRQWPMFSWNNLVFFLAPYAAGIHFGDPVRYEQTRAFFRRWRGPAMAIVLATSASVWFFISQPEPVRYGPVDPFETVTYIQKMIAAPLLLLWLHRYDEVMPRLLSRLADDSFAIYFLHIWLVVGWLWLLDHSVGAMTSPLFYEAQAIVGTIVILGILLVLIGALRRLLGKWSRPLVGA